MNAVFPMNFLKVILHSRRNIFCEFATRTQRAVIHSPTTNFRTTVRSSTTQKTKIACSTIRINRWMRQWICTSSFIRHFAIPIPQTRKYWERHVFACQRRLFALERRVFALSHYATHTLIWNTYYKSLSDQRRLDS